MSGLKYVHLPYGPVPDNFDILLGKMASDRIAHIEVSYVNGYEFHHKGYSAKLKSLIQSRWLRVAQRRHSLVEGVPFFLGETDTGTRPGKTFGILSVGGFRVINFTKGLPLILN